MSRAALDESLARLDAALGVTPARPQHRTPFISKGRQLPPSSVSSILDGRGLDTSVADAESPFANVSGMGESVQGGNGSFFGIDVTAPVPAVDQTMDMTAALPAHHNAQVLFSEFVRVLVGEGSSVAAGEGGVWGEVEQYEQLCDQQAQVIDRALRKMPRHHHTATRTRQVSLQLSGERNMWRLLRSLYMDRQCRSDTPDELLQEEEGGGGDWLHSDQTVITQLYDASREIRETQLVIDWLEKNASDELERMPEKLEYYGDSHVAWENTLRVLKASARGHDQGRMAAQLITSADPDAPVRQGKALHDLDQEDERVLSRRVMLCLRSGVMGQAQDRCVGSGQHWRAAAMEGWKLHHDPSVTDPTRRNPVQGNPYRDVWKSLAWRASSDLRLPQQQRAVYGALCGNLPAMLLVCQDWEDLLWAHLRAMADQRVEEVLRGRHAGGMGGKSRVLVPLPQHYPEQRMTLEGVLSSVEKSCSAEELQNPYFIISKHLILDDMAGLVGVCRRWLSEGPPAPHLLRCLTHLLLVLRRSCVLLDPDHLDTVNDVLHACVKCAMERGDVEQVAWYTATLPAAQQVARYSSFLINISDPPQRCHALHLANTVGLDTAAIAATTAAIIRLSPGAGSGAGSECSSSGSDMGETGPGERIKISGLDWLLFDDSLRQEALLQGLALVRTFLIARKISAANMTMDKLPRDTLSLVSGDDKEDLPAEVEAAVREYLCIKTFLSAQECFSDWFDHYHQQKPSCPPPLPPASTFTDQIAHDHASLQHQSSTAKWQAQLDRLTKTACERLYNVLLFPDGGWLVDPCPLPHISQDSQQGSDGCQRLQYLSLELAAREPDRDHQLATLRSIYIPQVCSLLQNILTSTAQHKQCLQLADVVASEQHQLYTAFGASEMQRFLLKMLEPSRYLLDNDKDALGYPLH